MKLAREWVEVSPESAAAMPSATDVVYALGRDPGESARLHRQSEQLQPDSAALLDRVGRDRSGLRYARNP